MIHTDSKGRGAKHCSCPWPCPTHQKTELKQNRSYDYSASSGSLGFWASEPRQVSGSMWCTSSLRGQGERPHWYLGGDEKLQRQPHMGQGQGPAGVNWEPLLAASSPCVPGQPPGVLPDPDQLSGRASAAQLLWVAELTWHPGGSVSLWTYHKFLLTPFWWTFGEFLIFCYS